jgi:hypothetical protein
MKVYVGNDPIVKNNPVCQGPITPDAKWENVDVTCSLVGRYVGIALSEQNYLQIGEVELWELSGGNGGGNGGKFTLNGDFTW